MGMFGWTIPRTRTSMVTITMEVEWRCATMAPTGQCVMKTGLTVKLQSSVTTWAIAHHIIVSTLT